MPWYFYVGVVIIFLGLTAGLVLFLPMRIFMRYLRKNRKDQATLTVKLSVLEIQTLIMRERGQTGATILLKAGRWMFRVPVVRTEKKGRKTAALKLRRWEFRMPPPDRENLKKVPELLRRIKPFFKKMSWRNFKMEMIFGVEDPALTGMAAGGCWMMGGVVLGLLKQYFRFETVPKVLILPQFSGPALQVRWEGELAMPLFRWVKLLLIIKSLGGATSGKSPH